MRRESATVQMRLANAPDYAEAFGDVKTKIDNLSDMGNGVLRRSDISYDSRAIWMLEFLNSPKQYRIKWKLEWM
jgi:hypothetical protein